MSEYQYYEFRSVDRSLTAGEMAELRKLSSRAEITATSFSNSYSYGNFRGNPNRMMEQYFDAFVYVANWGARHFMLRLPVRGVDLPSIEAYAGGGLSFWIKSEFVILSFSHDGEGEGGWEAGAEWMPSLISLREELFNGDFRSLYLGWLSGIYGDIDDDEPEPPVPPGLRTLSAAQDDLVAFLRIDSEMLETAAQRSVDRTESEWSQAQLADWLQSRSTTERDTWLVKLLGESAQATRAEALLQFRQSLRAARGQTRADTIPPRTCRELREAAEAIEREAERRRAEAVAAKQAKEARQAAKLRRQELDRLALRIDGAWDEVDRKVTTKQMNQYALAVKELTDLRDLAVRDGQIEQFTARLLSFVQRHAKKSAFLERLRKAGLNG